MKRNDLNSHTPPPKDLDLGADSGWEDYRILLREANRPPAPPPERLQALRQRALQRYAVEHPSLWTLVKERLDYWAEAFRARTVASRFLHTVAAGAAGAVIAVVVLQSPSPRIATGPSTPGPGPAIHTETPRLMTSPGDGKSLDQPGVASPGAMASGKLDLADPALAGDGHSLASLAATPANSPANRIEKSSQPAATASTAPSGVPNPSSESDPGTGFATAGIGAPESNPAFRLPDDVSNLVNPLTPVGAGAMASSKESAPASAGSAADKAVVDEFMKLYAKMSGNGDDQYLTDLTEILFKVRDAQRSRPGDSAESQPFKALSLADRAQQALQNKDYIGAINAYNQVALELPGSSFAFVARSRIADIEYEYLDQYASAFKDYSLCIDNFAGLPLSDEKRDQIHGRWEILQQNSINDFEPLKLFRTAEKSTAYVAQQCYQDLLETYPESTLAGAAARNLAALAAADLEGKYIDPQRVLDTLQNAVKANPNSSQAAAIQFAIGDLLQQRLFNPRMAVTAYQRVLGMNPSPALAADAGNRLQELNLMRFATPTP